MPKNVFWPAALAIMGFVLLSSNLGMLPHNFWNLWPIILIVVGLGGLITADRDEWLCETGTKSKSKKKSSKTSKKSKKK
ncbi:MAG: hypothetical protein XD95_0421 [Microgenomates bacterium 39_7]|nr:MAG: hypothetical protein XD95_0421 [Microgenomates bacterium 39_7]